MKLLTENKGHSELSHMLWPPAPPPAWWFCRVWKCPSCNTILSNSCHVWPLVGLWGFSSKLDYWKTQFYYFLMPPKTFSILLLAFPPWRGSLLSTPQWQSKTFTTVHRSMFFIFSLSLSFSFFVYFVLALTSNCHNRMDDPKEEIICPDL